MVRKWKLRHHLEWNWKTKNEWCGGYIYWISQLQWWYILCMCIVQLSVSISADWEDAITPLVNAGVFWSLFSFDFDDFPQAEFHQTSNLVTVPIFKKSLLPTFHTRTSRDCRKLMKTNHWIEKRLRGRVVVKEKCLQKNMTKNFLYFTLSCIKLLLHSQNMSGRN